MDFLNTQWSQSWWFLSLQKNWKVTSLSMVIQGRSVIILYVICWSYVLRTATYIIVVPHSCLSWPRFCVTMSTRGRLNGMLTGSKSFNTKNIKCKTLKFLANGCYNSLAKTTLLHLYYSTALDAVQDCLRLLESMPESSENQEQWLDVKAQALLWQYICTLEANIREVKSDS